MSIQVLLAEDHELTRKGIAYGLKQSNEIEVLAAVENGYEAVQFVKTNKPDVILMDILMPVLNGINATKEIKENYPDIKIIILTSINEKENVLASFKSGANAYCMKNIKIDDLITVIKTVINGAIWIDPDIAGYILEILQSKTNILDDSKLNNTDFNLTNREKEILKLIAEGLSNKDIAEQLFLSLHTVKNHVRNIIQKLAVDDRTQAAILALKENLV